MMTMQILLIYLKNSKLSMTQIAKDTKHSRNTIMNVNKGLQQYVRDNFKENFPIRKDSRRGYEINL